jgi:AGZA family xanthine/uracil permease-like MFS transporter
MRFLDRLLVVGGQRVSARTEVMAGLTSFAAMAYILAVNPNILAVTGMDRGALVTATALASALMTAVFALATNYPIALAPGMGMNAFFAYTLCVGMKLPWQAALGLTFLSGLLFLVLTVTGLRRRIIEAIPLEIKTAISCGIGLFIAFIGLKNAGIVAADPVTFVKAGHLASPPVLLALAGIVLTALLVWRRVRGAMILAILALTAAGLLVPAAGGEGRVTQLPAAVVSLPASLAPSFLKLDLGYVLARFFELLPALLALLFVDLFDNMGTLIGVCQRAGLLDERGNLPRIGRALAADAGAAMVGACLGTSTVTSYIESAAGVEEGGRTGLTSLVVAACFLLALFFSPVILAIPAVATAPALVVVGIFMMQGVTRLDLSDFSVAAPCVLTMLLMPLTSSISEGLSLGFLCYVALKLGTGRGRELTPTAWALGALFLLHVLFG